MWDNLFSSVNLLEKGVNATWLRNEVISNNIANVDTPGFKASEVEFEDIMAATLGIGDGRLQLAATDENHISSQQSDVNDVEAVVTTNDSISYRYDENSVDIESEMVELAKNSIEYYTLVSKMNSEFRKLDTAINVS